MFTKWTCDVTYATASFHTFVLRLTSVDDVVRCNVDAMEVISVVLMRLLRYRLQFAVMIHACNIYIDIILGTTEEAHA